MHTRLDNFEHYYLSDGLVLNPSAQSIYHIKQQDYNVTISFAGNKVKELSFFNFTAGYCWSKEEQRKIRTQSDFVSKEALPPSYHETSLPPVMLASLDGSLKTISMVNKIEVNFNDTEFNMNTFYSEPSFSLKAYNQELQESYQKLVKVPLMIGDYPIFFDDKIASVKELEKIYADFIAANSDEKLSQQYKASEDHCHARAKVVADYLRQVHGFNVLMLFKIYDKQDWKKFGEDDGWIFHCAAMPVTDQEKTPWVWDPWVGSNKKLLTIHEWVYRSNGPTPKKVMIVNQAVLNDYTLGKVIEAPHFFVTHSENMVDSYKKVAVSAFPQYPLATNNFSFFKAKAALKDQKENGLLEVSTHKRKSCN